MSSAAATSLISTPDRLLSFTAVALNRSPYLATLRGPALATTHLQAVSPRSQLIRGKLGVRHDPQVRTHQYTVATEWRVVPTTAVYSRMKYFGAPKMRLNQGGRYV